MAVLDDVLLRALTDGDDMVGLLERLTELPGVNLRVDLVVELRQSEEDQVVDGHHTLDAALADADGQFAREPVEELHAVALQVLHDAVAAPVGRAQFRVLGDSRGVAELHVFLLHDLFPQVVAPLVGGIQPHLQGVGGEVVHECTAVASQACTVFHDALGIIADDRIVSHVRLKCLNTNLTMMKFAGTAMASTAMGASSRLRPSHRKKLKSTMCSR